MEHDRDVQLHHRDEVALVLVLGLVHLLQQGYRLAVEGLDEMSVAREGLAEQTGLVGPDDAHLGIVQLDAQDLRIRQGEPEELGEAAPGRRRVPVHEVVGVEHRRAVRAEALGGARAPPPQQAPPREPPLHADLRDRDQRHQQEAQEGERPEQRSAGRHGSPMIDDAGWMGKCPDRCYPCGQMTGYRLRYQGALDLAHPISGMRLAGAAPVRRYRFVLISVIALLAFGIGCAAPTGRADFDQAVGAFEAGDYKGAIARLETFMQGGRDSARDRILLGWCYLKLDYLERAKTELERGLALGPRDPNAYYAYEGLGWIAYRTGDQSRALSAFNESLRHTPGYHNAHDGL